MGVHAAIVECLGPSRAPKLIGIDGRDGSVQPGPNRNGVAWCVRRRSQLRFSFVVLSSSWIDGSLIATDILCQRRSRDKRTRAEKPYRRWLMPNVAACCCMVPTLGPLNPMMS